ncbi:MAG TPA: hypothetical protein VK988_06860 [Acidimicrobiales bacterium]|nr:hypothetical protein [Acidimicrobiales bacterium]
MQYVFANTSIRRFRVELGGKDVPFACSSAEARLRSEMTFSFGSRT